MSKELYTLEFPVRSSPAILFDFLCSPEGLQEWFADKVVEKGKLYTFSWSGSSEQAEVVEKIQDKVIRFHWLNSPANEYFEFSIEKSEITNQTIFIIKDFAEKSEIKDQTHLWDSQVKDLFHRIGS